MAPQTRTQRQAAAKKAAATRKRNASRQSNGTVRAAARRSLAERIRVEALARQAERAILIPVGAALEARDRIVAFVRNQEFARRQLNRFERRGATALRRNRRVVERRAQDVRDSVESHANGVHTRATDVVERVRSLA